jgi:hypothetical protein
VHRQRAPALHGQRLSFDSAGIAARADVGGYLCGDAHTVVAVNVTPVDGRSLAESVRARTALFRQARSPRSIVVPGSPRAERLDGLTQLGNPAEPQTLTMVFAIARDERVTLSIRSWPRDDLGREVERILGSFEIIGHDYRVIMTTPGRRTMVQARSRLGRVRQRESTVGETPAFFAAAERPSIHEDSPRLTKMSSCRRCPRRMRRGRIGIAGSVKRRSSSSLKEFGPLVSGSSRHDSQIAFSQ